MNAARARLTQLVTPPSEPRGTDRDELQEQLGVPLPNFSRYPLTTHEYRQPRAV
ncbi:hypothetical protein [Streptomyces sp. NPDC005374]|uniref:hypothetical protein n=1 Tax=Streptomyces sp. NPDC005374 TaxID=3364713 RepID=UPI00368E3C76